MVSFWIRNWNFRKAKILIFRGANSGINLCCHFWLCNHWTRSCTDSPRKRRWTCWFLQVWFHGQSPGSTLCANGFVPDGQHWFYHCFVHQPYNVLWWETWIFQCCQRNTDFQWTQFCSAGIDQSSVSILYTWLFNNKNTLSEKFIFCTKSIISMYDPKSVVFRQD